MNGLPATRIRELKGMIEAMIFSSDEPVAVKTLIDIFEASEFDGQRMEIESEEIARIVAGLNEEYAAGERSYRIIEIAGGYQYATLPGFSSWVGKIFKEKAKRRLSQSAIESLAIIAYKQPVTKPDLEFIRGVDCDYVLKTLLERNLVAIIGRATTPGRPLLYGTTQDFLRHFGLNALSDLPKPREIEELLGETELEVEKRLLEEQQQADEDEALAPKKERAEGPRFRKPIIPKKREVPAEQLPLPIAREAPSEPGRASPEPALLMQAQDESAGAGSPAGQDANADEQSGLPAAETSGMAGTGETEKYEESPESSSVADELLNEIITEEKIQALADDVRPGADTNLEPPQESMTWEQIPEDHGPPQDTTHTGVVQPSIEEIHENVGQARERGWTKFKHRVQGLLKRLFG